MANIKLSNDFVVTMHNKLVSARYLDTYTVNEQKILNAVLSNIEPPEFDVDKNGKRYIKKRVEQVEDFRVPIKEFTEWLGISDPNYAKFKKTIKRLMKKLIEIEQEDGSWEIFQWVSKASYIAKQGIAEIRIHPELYPYLLNLESDFTKIKIGALVNFKNKHTTRIYQLVKKWSKMGMWQVSISDLKKLLGIDDNKTYAQFGHFKSKVLTPAIEEINKYTELQLEIEEVKESRKITRLTFKISKYNKKQLDNVKSTTKEKQASQSDTVYAAELLNKYKIKNQKAYNNHGEMVILEGRERVQLIILNRLSKVDFTVSPEVCKLLEEELVKIEDLDNFDLSRETFLIFNYVNSSPTITQPEMFILSKTKKLVTLLLDGESANYLTVIKPRNFKQNPIPDWWFEGERKAAEIKTVQEKIITPKKEVKIKPEPVVEDSNLTLLDLYNIRTQIKFGTKDDEIRETHDIDEYRRLDEKYGIKNILENNRFSKF